MENPKNIEFSALKIFVAVAESRSFTQASERMAITQSAVSQAIKQLERSTESILVDRQTRPIKLTPSGQVLYEYADMIFSETHRMLVNVRSAVKGTVGKLKVGMIDSFCDISGGRFVEYFKPFATKMTLRTGLVSPLSQDLLDRDLDLLITSDPMANHPELDSYSFFRDPFVMIISESLCTSDTSVHSISENVPFIQYDRNTLLGVTANVIARRLKITLNTYYELDNTQAILRFVSAGHGWAIISGLCLVGFPELLSGIRIMNLDNGRNARYISLLARRNELGDLPSGAVNICREICTEKVIPELLAVAPWLKEHAIVINE